jgi:hypothetical protein
VLRGEGTKSSGMQAPWKSIRGMELYTGEDGRSHRVRSKSGVLKLLSTSVLYTVLVVPVQLPVFISKKNHVVIWEYAENFNYHISISALQSSSQTLCCCISVGFNEDLEIHGLQIPHSRVDSTSGYS